MILYGVFPLKSTTTLVQFYDVMPDSHLGNKSDIFYHNNKNNQLERQVQPPRDIIRCPVGDLSIPLE